MRDCPVCKSAKRDFIWRSDFLVPDGWTKSPYLDWNKCECGMIYGDHPDSKQEDYDTYYRERYGYGVLDDDVKYRLAKRAAFVRDRFKRASRIVDFGGGDSGLEKLLTNVGFKDVTTYNIGDIMPPLVDCVIAEHVLEHIYDLEKAMNLITNSLKDEGGLIIDIPDAGRIAFDKPADMPMMDYTHVHINHFRVNDILRLCERFGFELWNTELYYERFCACRMFIFYKNADVAGASKEHVLTNMAAKIEKLKELGDKEVILWGAGDIALHCLSQVKVNIQYYVSNDPAFKDATIQGLPVKEKPDTDHPIIILAQSQKQKLLDNIKALGVTNELIII